tara:strand:- start:152 stop:301 length:150 start_codon:yes stop_codon:yes gene_type:complete
MLLNAPPTNVVEHAWDAQTDTLAWVRVLGEIRLLLIGVFSERRHIFCLR